MSSRSSLQRAESVNSRKLGRISPNEKTEYVEKFFHMLERSDPDHKHFSRSFVARFRTDSLEMVRKNPKYFELIKAVVDNGVFATDEQLHLYQKNHSTIDTTEDVDVLQKQFAELQIIYQNLKKVDSCMENIQKDNDTHEEGDFQDSSFMSQKFPVNTEEIYSLAKEKLEQINSNGINIHDLEKRFRKSFKEFLAKFSKLVERSKNTKPEFLEYIHGTDQTILNSMIEKKTVQEIIEKDEVLKAKANKYLAILKNINSLLDDYRQKVLELSEFRKICDRLQLLVDYCQNRNRHDSFPVHFKPLFSVQNNIDSSDLSFYEVLKATNFSSMNIYTRIQTYENQTILLTNEINNLEQLLES